jgi:ABC-type methionine transport system ATPase subunit
MQRVAIARALRNSPKVLIADEPTGNLASGNAEGILNVFRELNRSGLTVVMVTHNAELAGEAGRIVSMKDGRVVTTDAAASAPYKGLHSEMKGSGENSFEEDRSAARSCAVNTCLAKECDNAASGDNGPPSRSIVTAFDMGFDFRLRCPLINV